MSFGYIRQRHYVDNAMRFMKMHEHDLNWCIHERYLLKCIAYLASMIMENYEKCFGIQYGYLPYT